MFKKLVLASTILALSSGIAFAHQYHSKPKKRCGILYNNYARSKPRLFDSTGNCCYFAPATYVGFSIGARDNFSGTPSTNFIGLDNGNVSLGYGGLVPCTCNFYLAAEVFGLGTISIKDYNSSGNGAKTTWALGASILPGFTLTNNSILYARLGTIYSRFSDQNERKTGWQGGVGSEIDPSPNWGVRTEFVYTWYGNVSGIQNTQSFVYNLGVVYRFI